MAVVGNCQVVSIAQILRAMLPRFAVHKYRPSGDKEKLAEALTRYDLVLTHPLNSMKFGPARSEETRANNRQVVVFPVIAFAGFHPDFFGDNRAKTFGSGAYHSIIVAAAFRSGLAAKDALNLLNGYNFARLGYMREYADGRKYLLARAAELDFDLSGILEEQEASGTPFMHTPNHPVIGVLTALCRMIVEKIGETADTNISVRDRLGARQRLPVYPFIARRLRVAGDETFTRLGSAIALEEYVSGTYERYSSAPAEFFDNRRIVKAAELCCGG